MYPFSPLQEDAHIILKEDYLATLANYIYYGMLLMLVALFISKS